jgi:hypothetical protein
MLLRQLGSQRKARTANSTSDSAFPHQPAHILNPTYMRTSKIFRECISISRHARVPWLNNTTASSDSYIYPHTEDPGAEDATDQLLRFSGLGLI